MKNLIIISLLLAFVSCSQIDSLDEFSHSSSVETSTRSENSDDIANSPLLNELRAYNDSLIYESTKATTNALILTPLMQRTIQIAIADFLGYQAGYQMATAEGADSNVAHIVATMESTSTSQTAARKVVSKYGGNIPHLPPSSGEPLKNYEKLYSAVRNNPNYTQLSIQEIRLLGDLSMFNGNINYFKAGIDHNLLIKKYGNGLSDSDIVTNMFDLNTTNIIYSEEFQSKMADETDYIIEGDIDYYYFFSKHNPHGFISLSQKKAAEITRLYTQLILTTYPSLDEHKSILVQYINAVTSSSEIMKTEKIILLNSFPIALTSKLLWGSLYSLNPSI